MSSAWGASWGGSWGSSWGATATALAGPDDQGEDRLDFARKERDRMRDLHADDDAIIHAVMALVATRRLH